MFRVLGKSRTIEAAPFPSYPRAALSRWQDFLETPLDPTGGTLSISQEPGLGVTVDETAPDRFRLLTSTSYRAFSVTLTLFCEVVERTLMSEQGDSVRLGVVGLGFMGQTHASNATEFGHQVVAGTDLDDDAREEFAETYGAVTYEDVKRMYDSEDLDAVAVSTPNTFHEPAVVSALERGYDVLCEKPLADDLASAERIAEIAEQSSRFCMVNFHNRLSTAMERTIK